MTLRQHYLQAARAHIRHELSMMRFDAINTIILARRARLHRGYKTWKTCGARVEDVHLERLLAAVMLRREARERMLFDPHEERENLAREIAQHVEFRRRAS